MGAPVASAFVSGCTANETTGRRYALRMADAPADPDDPLDLETAGVTVGQVRILDAAIEDGEYAEENVNWDPLPGREGITMEFKLLLQRFARHVGRDPTITEPTTFETPTRYDRSTYVATVEVESG